MPWTVYNSNGQILQGSATLADDSVTSAKIVDGAIVNADINASAAIAFTKMANLTTARALVSDGSGDVSVSAVTSTEIGYLDGVTSAIQTQLNAAGGAITREGSNTTEATTTSTSDTDLLTVSSLTIAATEPCTFFASLRRSTGASAQSGIGLKVNSTTTRGSFAWMYQAADVAYQAMYKAELPARVTNYTQTGLILAIPHGGAHVHGTGFDSAGRSDNIPTVQITSMTLIANSANGSVTSAADEGHAYSWTAS